MKAHPRIYNAVLEDHLSQHRQMAFVSGARQVGKTTLCRSLGSIYLNWDNLSDKRLILKGPTAVADAHGLSQLHESPPVFVFDELHKYSKWKSFLKGFFDTYSGQSKILVTGSSRLDLFRRGGDSLMGRYFLYRMHPFSVAELVHESRAKSLLHPPKPLSEENWAALWRHGGFPEPYLKRTDAFTRRWASLRQQQLSREDLRELAQLQDLGPMEVLVQILAERSAQQLVYANLAQELNVTGETAKRWVGLLENLHFGFCVRPWFKSVANALRKEPKWFLRDWSGVADPGARSETFVACHLLKALEAWTDLGLGAFELRYLRTKQKKEIDFVIVRDGKPWLLLEVKHADRSLSPTLCQFHEQLKVAHSFQVVIDLPYEHADCFQHTGPLVVPARTFLSQLF